MTTNEKLAEATIRGAMDGLFGHAAGQCTAEEMQQWLYEHEAGIPAGIRAVLFAAQQACNAYGLFSDQAHRD